MIQGLFSKITWFDVSLWNINCWKVLWLLLWVSWHYGGMKGEGSSVRVLWPSHLSEAPTRLTEGLRKRTAFTRMRSKWKHIFSVDQEQLSKQLTTWDVCKRIHNEYILVSQYDVLSPDPLRCFCPRGISRWSVIVSIIPLRPLRLVSRAASL